MIQLASISPIIYHCRGWVSMPCALCKRWQLNLTRMLKKGHLQDDIILLLLPESFRVLFSCANLGFCYLNLTEITKFKYERKKRNEFWSYRLERTLSVKISSKRHIFRVTSRVEYSVYSVLFTPGTHKSVYLSLKLVLVWARHNDYALLLPSFRSRVHKLNWVRSTNSARDISCQRKFCGNLGKIGETSILTIDHSRTFWHILLTSPDSA